MRAAKLTVLIPVFFLFAANTSVNAQSPIYLGLKGGVSIPNLSAGGGNPVSSGYSSIEGPYFGIFGDFGITHHFSIQAELNYSAQGGKKNGQQAIPSGEFAPPGTPGLPPYFYANYDSKARLNYLELPILAKFTFPIGGAWKFLVDAGPYVGYLMKGKNVTSGSSPVYEDQGETTPVTPAEPFDSTESITSQIHRFNFGIQGGIGLEYFLKHCGYFYLQVGGNYGFMNIQKGTENGKNQTGAATAAIGYAFNLRGHKKK
jgi:hypothetical protein